MKVRFTNTEWRGQSDLYPNIYTPLLEVTRLTSTDGNVALVSGESEKFLTNAFVFKPVLQRVLCRFETDYDDVWYATVDLGQTK